MMAGKETYVVTVALAQPFTLLTCMTWVYSPPQLQWATLLTAMMVTSLPMSILGPRQLWKALKHPPPQWIWPTTKWTDIMAVSWGQYAAGEDLKRV